MSGAGQSFTTEPFLRQLMRFCHSQIMAEKRRFDMAGTADR
jgi:hypothetical protein